MARQRDPNRDKAFEIYKEHNGEITNRAIAEILNCPEKSVGGWKSKDKWNQKLNGVLQSDEQSTPIENTEYSNGENVQQSAVSSGKGKRKRGGNPNPSCSFPKRNKAAEKHGFYSKVIPEELQELFDKMEDAISTEDMLWDQIRVQYMAIMRAQSIMFVESKDEMIKELKKRKDTEWGEELEYEFQFAWERQAQFLTAQSRAISELRATIEQFESAADKTDKRHLELKKMRLSIEKSNIEIEALQKGDKDNGPIQIQIIGAKKKE